MIMVIGLLTNSLQWFEHIFTAPSYDAVTAYRKMWQQQQQMLTIDSKTGTRKVHIFTVASEQTEELDNLQFSARLAGVEVNVR
jgi:hypothetical protein